MGKRLSRIIVRIKIKIPKKYRCRFCPYRKKAYDKICVTCRIEEAKKWNKPY